MLSKAFVFWYDESDDFDPDKAPGIYVAADNFTEALRALSDFGIREIPHRYAEIAEYRDCRCSDSAESPPPRTPPPLHFRRNI